jgi:hypothetical protein
LSLALRKAGDTEPVDSHPITLADLFNAKTDEQDNHNYVTVSVMRAATKTIYSVPRTGRDGRALAVVGGRHAAE